MATLLLPQEEPPPLDLTLSTGVSHELEWCHPCRQRFLDSGTGGSIFITVGSVTGTGGEILLSAGGQVILFRTRVERSLSLPARHLLDPLEMFCIHRVHPLALGHDSSTGDGGAALVDPFTCYLATRLGQRLLVT